MTTFSTTTAAHAHTVDQLECIELCVKCGETCSEMLFTHCLIKGGEHLKPEHVLAMVDCAEICKVTADFLNRKSSSHRHLCAVCAELCEKCARSCRAIADGSMERCADACELCQEACEAMTRVHA